MTYSVATGGADHLNGGSGSSYINGGAGSDRINGGAGSDVLDGGAGSDRVSGDSGDDLLVYVAAQNVGATDVYDGGSGRDGLALVLTRAEWMNPKLQSDIARFLAFVARETNPNNGQASNAEFRFTAFDLRVSKVEALFVVVDGVLLDPRDGAVTLAADGLTATEDAASVSVDLLANDKVPDLVRSVTNTQGAHGGVQVTFTPSAPGQPAKAQAVYTPNAAHWQSLAAGQTGTDSFTYTVTDADGDTVTQTVTVTITGTNDAPIAVVDISATAENQSLTIDVLANDKDVDAGSVLTVTAAAAPSGKGAVSIVDNKVRFDPGADFDHLAAGATEVVTISYSIADGAGGVSSSTVAVTVTGTNDAPTVTSDAAAASGSVVEAGNAEDGAALAGTPSATGALTASDIDDGAALTWTGDKDGAFGTFAISAAGVWTYTLDARADGLAEGETRTETFTATVADGLGGIAAQVVTISVTGTNDAPVVTSGPASGVVTEAGHAAGTPAATGALTSSDADAGATATWSGGADGVYGRFAIDAGGAWTYTLDNGRSAADALGEGESRTETFTATVTDDRGAVATQVVTITVTGTNDKPVVTSTAEAAIGSVAEAGATSEGTASATGTLTSSDVDAGATATWSGGGAGAFGTFAITAAGAWTYTLDNGAAATQALGVRETRIETFNATVTDDKGATATQVVTITIAGANDAPVVVADATTAAGAVTEIADGAAGENAVTLTASGSITFADVDANDVHAATVIARSSANLGSLSLSAVDQSGDAVGWTYSVADAALDGLAAGETRTETFDVTIADGNGGTVVRTVSVTITGTNDAPAIKAATVAAGSVTEVADGAEGENGSDRTASGSIAFADIDGVDVHSVSVTPQGSNYLGSLTLGAVDQSANTLGWSFSAADAALDSLAEGERRVQNYAVTVSDGQGGTVGQVVSVTITGTNDAPVVTGAVTGTATEDGAKSTLNALANTSDADAGAKLSVIDVPAKLPAGVSYNAGAGSFTLDPAAYQSLAEGKSVTVTVDYGVSDGSVTQAASVGWTVTGVNDAPVVTGAVRGAATEGGAKSTLAALANASDVDADTVFSVVDLPATLPAGVTFDASTQSFTLDPAQYRSLNAGETVTVSVSYGVSDGVATTPASVGWTVTGTNDAPVVTASDDGAIKEDGVTTASGSIRYTDADANASATVAFAPAAANYLGTFNAVVAENGRVAWTFDVDNAALQYLAAGQVVTQSYEVTIDDGKGGTVKDTVTVEIGGVNDAIVRGRTIGADFEDNGDVRSGTTRVYFSDIDVTDVHDVKIEPVGDFIGSAKVRIVENDAEGRSYIEIDYAFSIKEIEAVPNDSLVQRVKVTITDGNGGELVIFRNPVLEDVEWYIGNETNEIVGWVREDRNVLVGNGGSDWLFGGNLSDQLYGDEGPAKPADEDNGIISFYSGNDGFDDLLNGNDGADQLTGGGGADAFQFDLGEADGDVVYDFNRAEGDRLHFTGWGEGATFTRVDATRWELATADGSIKETITFANAAEILVSDLTFFG